MLKRGLTGAALAALLGMAALVTSSPPADAAQTCGPGYVCLYQRLSDGRGGWYLSLAAGYEGNAPNVGWYLRSGGRVYNFGKTHPGADHIDVTISLGVATFTRCLHQGAINFTMPNQTATDIPGWATVKSLRWRGECKSWENDWH